jgi:hypothetical protein
MVKKLIPAVLLMTFCFWSVSSAFAEAVVVEGDRIFFVDDGKLNVLDLTGKPVECLGDTALTGATDVVIADGKAIVTVDDGGSVGVVIVDVSACLSDFVEVEVEACIAKVDLDEGTMEIPCVIIGDDVSTAEDTTGVYTVHMTQRGDSMNWEVSFVDINGDLLNYRRNEDDGDGS